LGNILCFSLKDVVDDNGTAFIKDENENILAHLQNSIDFKQLDSSIVCSTPFEPCPSSFRETNNYKSKHNTFDFFDHISSLNTTGQEAHTGPITDLRCQEYAVHATQQGQAFSQGNCQGTNNLVRHSIHQDLGLVLDEIMIRTNQQNEEVFFIVFNFEEVFKLI
jgi:hypothetical protein